MKRFAVAAALMLVATAASASWYDDYDAGIAAVGKGQWAVVIQKMTAAINAHPNESDHEREYGAIFISYHPFYYRGVAYLNTGKYEQAIADLEKTKGAGETDLGPIGDLLRRAKAKLEASNATPEPQPPAPQPQPIHVVPPTPVPVPVPVPVPAGPTIDPGLRQRVVTAINEAQASLGGARNRKATASLQYAQAIGALADANAKANGAKSNDELSAALTSAQNAKMYADSAVAPGVIATTTGGRTNDATNAALSDISGQLRTSLMNYFNGDFEAAASGFDSLTKQLPRNGWVWAFLGASKYSLYAFEREANYKNDAENAFRKAKLYGKWHNGALPDRYFSKKIRKFFSTLS